MALAKLISRSTLLWAVWCLIAFPAVSKGEGTVEYPAAKGPGNGKHVVFVTGDEEYRSEEGLPMLAKILARRHGFRCTVLFSLDDDGTINPNKSTSLAGSEALDSADAVVMLIRFRKWPEDVMQRFEKACKRGIPLIGLRTSTHAFQLPESNRFAAEFNKFGEQVLGEEWVSHWGKHKFEATKGIFEPANKENPILKGIQDGTIFGDTDVYEAYPPADATVLIRGQVLKGMSPEDPPADYKKTRLTDKAEQGINDPMMPVAWTREHDWGNGKKSRTFCTTMGAATDLQNAPLRRLIVNSIFWGLNLDVPPEANVEYVGDFHPTFYGFNEYRKGVRPGDLALNVLSLMESDDEKLTHAASPSDREELPPSRLPLEFNKRERVALVGNSLAERFTLFGHFETLLHKQYAEQELIVRNFARPADEVANRQRSNDYTVIDDPLASFGPDTMLCFFGFNESYAGPEGVDAFKANYEKFLDEMNATYPRGREKKPLRFVLISPIPFEHDGPGNTQPIKFQLPEGTRENANLALYAAATAEVAKKRGLAFVDLYQALKPQFDRETGLQYTINGVHHNEEGDRLIAVELMAGLTGKSSEELAAQLQLNDRLQHLLSAVNDKAWVHLQDYRMLNGWYVYGGRRTWDRETFPLEYAKIRRMAAARDNLVWELAKGEKIPSAADDSKTGELFVPETRFGINKYSEGSEPNILPPEEEVKTFKVPEGFDVKLFASEREFPQLSKPCQLNFDSKGRLWAACMPTYPQWKPGDPRPDDRLVIFEDTDNDGKADVAKSFYDKLHCPTGFEFWEGGVLVVDQPRLLWLKDSDGDDKADIVVHLFDGWATDDTHHTVGAWEFSHGGILHMLEGVAVSTAVETPWGPFRNKGTPGCYQLDPRTLKIRHFVTPGYGNPWCYVFNPWGQGFCGDGTTAAQHWDSPLSGAQFSARRALDSLFDTEGMRPVVGTEFLFTRHFPDEVQGNFVYACVINMNGIPQFKLHEDGAGYRGARLKKTVGEQQLPDDLLASTDKHFRPTDPQIGPDGALWFGDWSNPLIGHMQYSQRDPNRDHVHGRIYRLTYPSRPLLDPVLQQEKGIPDLLGQLSDPEPRVRSRARNEIHQRPQEEVLTTLAEWLPTVTDDRLMIEALWIQQSFHAIDLDLAVKCLKLSTGEARAATVHVLADEVVFGNLPRERLLELIAPAVVDEHPRVRLEAVRALSFVPSLEAVELAWKCTTQPVDYWISYTLAHTVGALQPVWEPSLKDGTLARRNPEAAKYLADYGLASAPGTQAQGIIERLLSSRTNPKDKEAAYEQLAAMNGNPENGKALFGRTCLNCHIVEGKGFEYGPNLSDVAKRLKFRDIIESVIDPNAKLDVKYQATLILTDEGKVHTGLLAAEDEQSVTLKVAATVGKDVQTIKIEKSAIEERQILKQSSMPEGLAGAFSPLDFLDLLAYLKTLQTPPPQQASTGADTVKPAQTPASETPGEAPKARDRKKMRD